MLFCPRSLFSFFDLFWKTLFFKVLYIRIGLMLIRIQLFTLMRIRFLVRIYRHRKDEFLH
jgi:hypothetical protein